MKIQLRSGFLLSTVFAALVLLIVWTKRPAQQQPAEYVTDATLLERVRYLPLFSWRYRGQTEVHIGPMAQRFLEAFGGRGKGTRIHIGDALGVIFATLQAILFRLEELERNSTLITH